MASCDAAAAYPAHDSTYTIECGSEGEGHEADSASGGDLWLQNDDGVILHLKAKRTGLMLSLGGDAVSIAMDD
jgi:hypothetical protein